MKIITTPMENMPGNRTIVLMRDSRQIVYYMEQAIAVRTVGGLWFKLVPEEMEKPVQRWLAWYLAKVKEEDVTEWNRRELEYMVEML